MTTPTSRPEDSTIALLIAHAAEKSDLISMERIYNAWIKTTDHENTLDKEDRGSLTEEFIQSSKCSPLETLLLVHLPDDHQIRQGIEAQHDLEKNHRPKLTSAL